MDCVIFRQGLYNQQALAYYLCTLTPPKVHSLFEFLNFRHILLS